MNLFSPSLFLFAERDQIINEAIAEAKANAKLKDARQAAAREAEKKSGKAPTASQFLARGFKKPSQRALMNGKARLLLEDMVDRAERKLLELKKNKESPLTSQEKVDILAEELVHTPGSLLKEEEMAKINLEIECVNQLRFARSCKRILNVNTFRTIDGVCNNILRPTLGASSTAFRRVLPALYEDGIGAPIGRRQAKKEFGKDPFAPPAPSARNISASIIRPSFVNEVPLTHILMQWGQFLDHDMDLGPEIEAECESCKFTDICEPIRVFPTDLKFGVGTFQNADCLEFRRAVPICKPGTTNILTPREQVNDLTSFIDGSMIYGSNRKQLRAVRQFRNGLLRTSAPPQGAGRRRLLPRITEREEFIQCRERSDCFVCGDIRCNEQYSLTVMHTLWVREHNRLARRLRSLNAHWSDERIFQEARAIVGASIQKITYYDYLPKVLGSQGFSATIGAYPGSYNSFIDPSIPNSFATAAYRYGHSLIRPFFDRFGPGYTPSPNGRLTLGNMFFNPSLFEDDGGTDSLVRGWLTQLPRSVDEFLNNILTSRLFETKQSVGMDLASLNIQRSRDHGMPLYGQWRNLCNKLLRTVATFQNPQTRANFVRLYGSENFIDLWIAGLSERRFKDAVLGPTFACIFGITFRDVRNGDRFFFERPGVFTPQQLTQLRRQTLSRILCDSSDNITQIQPDAFRQFNDGQSRVSCNRIPRVNLGPWRETACYIRASIPSVIRRTLLLAKKDGKWYTYHNKDTRECLPMPCPPSSTVPVPISAFPRIKRYTSCRFTSRFASTSLSGSSSVLEATIRDSNILSSNGIFRSLSSCQGSRVNGITWTCDSTVEALEEKAEILDDGDDPTSTEPDSPDSLTEKPPGLDDSAVTSEIDTKMRTNGNSLNELEQELSTHQGQEEEEDRAKDSQTLSQEFLKSLQELQSSRKN